MDPLKCLITLGVLIAHWTSQILAEKAVLCYVVGWAARRPDWGKFTVQDVDPQLCTHVVYAFMGVDENKNNLKYFDRIIDLDSSGKRLYQINRLKTLKEKNPRLKVLASIKASSDGAKKFSELIRNPERRKTLVRNIQKFVKERSLDGIDICWQFPGVSNGGSTQDKANSLIFFRELKQALKPDGLLLTVHILGLRHAMEQYDIRGVSDVVDFINLAPMEFTGPWDKRSGIMAPLKSVMGSVDYMLSKGANPQKVLLGLPLYGHAYLLNTAPTTRSYKGLALNKTFASPRTNEPGFIAYSEICHNIKNTKGWIQHWDGESQTPVAINGKKFVSFENVKSLQMKADLVSSKSLGGVMLWALDLDDFHGICKGGKFPVTTFLRNYIKGSSSTPSAPATSKPVLTPLSIDSTSTSQALTNESGNDKVFLCYMVAWAYNRPSQGKFTVEDARNDHCTHVVYAFTHLDEATNMITLASPGNKNELRELKNLKTHKRNLKVMASIGGYSQGSRRFSYMAASEESRGIFIASLLSFIKEYGLDGIDICWQFPGLRDGRPLDRENSLTLLKEIKAAFRPFRYILTLHVLGHRYVVDAYQIKAVSEFVDFINFAAMEYHGSWESTTQIATPLTSSDDANVKSNLDYILSKGVSPNKILLGLPTFGHAYALPEAPRGRYIDVHYDHLVGSQWTREDGLIAYNELCYEMHYEDSEWSEDWEEFSQTPIAYSGNVLATYENERSLSLKAKLVEQKNLAGVMIWSLDMDDFNAACKKSGGKKYPLLAAVADTLYPKQSAPSKPSGNSSGCVIVTTGPHSSIVTCDYGSF